VLRDNGIHLERKRSWCVSRDPDFAQKAADVVGLYLNPPANAIVFSVDEKPSIQALERTRGFAKAGKSIVQGEGSTYKRNGVANLFAALDVATGHVLTETTQTKTRIDFLSFMDKVVASQPEGKDIHVVLDNLSTHKRCDEWLAAHPSVKFHFTPTGASWLNQVEIWFNVLTRQALDGASFASLDQLVKALRDYTTVYNKTSRPFKWRKREVRGTQLRNTVMNLQI
jgi:transposase